jgi:hypothetical protein
MSLFQPLGVMRNLTVVEERAVRKKSWQRRSSLIGLTGERTQLFLEQKISGDLKSPVITFSIELFLNMTVENFVQI